jgi:MFS family permease
MSSRDLPKSFNELAFSWRRHLNDEVTLRRRRGPDIELSSDSEATDKKKDKVQMKTLWPAFCSGAGLFSDGYVNNSIGTVSTCLKSIYGDAYSKSNAISNVSSIAFAGTVVGQLVFGYISDNIARKGGMLSANIMLIFFTLLCTVGTWERNGDPTSLFTALTVFRFFLGIGIGAEYPTASVIASEFANQLPEGKRNRYFVWFTNFMIDTGFVVSAFVPLVCLWIFREDNLEPVWRLTLGIGAIPPISLFFMRLKMKDSESFQKMSMKKVKKVPYLLILKFYWFRLTIVSLIWFIYDFSAYSFGIYSSVILQHVVPDGNLYQTFGWNVVFNLFYIPGAFLGALLSDYIGPRFSIVLGTFLQGIVGFIMSGCYPKLKEHIGAFVVVYGIFSTLGELGPGDNIGAVASKTSATSVRGTYYGIAAAMGKIGAFVGTYVFPIIIKNAGGEETDKGNQAPFYVSSALCMFSAFLALFFCPSVGQNAINQEDYDFINYLKANNYDVSQIGDGSFDSDNGIEEVFVNDKEKKSEGINVESDVESSD